VCGEARGSIEVRGVGARLRWPGAQTTPHFDVRSAAARIVKHGCGAAGGQTTPAAHGSLGPDWDN